MELGPVQSAIWRGDETHFINNQELELGEAPPEGPFRQAMAPKYCPIRWNRLAGGGQLQACCVSSDSKSRSTGWEVSAWEIPSHNLVSKNCNTVVP